ncbi:cytoskeleton protein RodZ [Alteromonadaceae bacterium Bs31]|nr:cytoskeleton protein RodZ [Alteromonadaceae bacterium Bs31]
MNGDNTPLEQTEEFKQLLEDGKPGAAIKYFREGKGVSIDELARETLIPDWKIRDLENDSYGGLGAAPFITGYLRKLAKILKLDSDALIEAFNKQARSAAEALIESEPASPVTTAYAPREVLRPKSSVFTKLTGVHGVLAVALLILIWIVLAWLTKAPEQQADEESAQANLSVTQPEEQVESVQQPEPEQGSTSSQADLSDTVVPESPQALPVPTPLPSISPTVVPTLAPVPVIAPAPVEERQASAAAQNQDLLTLTFSADCWVEISDASGELKFAQLKRTGDNLQLFGEAPFEVMLGNARVVDVLINGQAFAVTPAPGRDTLRFTVTP